MIVLSTKETAAQFPTNPNGYVNSVEYVKARYPDAAAEERRSKPGYGKSINLIIVAAVDGKRKAISPACGSHHLAYRKAAERLGWHELMTPPKVKAGDVFEGSYGVLVRAHRVFWHNSSLCRIVEYETHPRVTANHDLQWCTETRFLWGASPTGENVDAG